MPPRPLLEVVVVTYNSWDAAEHELRRFCDLAKQAPDVRWCFVDNSPGAADWSRIAPLVGNLENVRSRTLPNPGFAAACNTAVRGSTAQWCLLLNPDVVLTVDQLRAIVDDLARRNCDGTVAVSMVTRGAVHAGVVLLPGWWFSDGALDGRSRVLGPSGGAGLFPVRTYLAHDGMLESLFAWGEDADLAWRLNRAGVACQVLDLRLEHQGGHSVAGSRAGTQFKVRLLYRNRLVIARRNLAAPKFAAFCLIYLTAMVVLSVKNFQRGALAASWLGFSDGLRAISTTERTSWPPST